MVTLCSTILLVLASNLVAEVAALPRPQGTRQQRAVDAAALIPYWERPLPPVKASPSTESDANPEAGYGMKRAVNLEGFVPYLHTPSPKGNTASNSEGTDAMKRAVDPMVFDDQGRTAPIFPTVERAVDVEAFDDQGRTAPIFPKVERAVDVGGFVNTLRICGSSKIKYDPNTQFCDDDGNVEPNGSPNDRLAKRMLMTCEAANCNGNVTHGQRYTVPLTDLPTADPSFGGFPLTVKRDADADAEPLTDKMTCNGVRYLPTQQTCTEDGSLVNLNPPQAGANTKRSTGKCGPSDNAISYDLKESYCNPITQQIVQVVPISNPGSAVQQDPSISPISSSTETDTQTG